MNDTTRPSAPQSSTSDGGLSAADRNRVRARIDEEAGRAADQAAALTANFDAIVEAAELVNTDDEHDPEGTTIAFERAQVSSLIDQAKADVQAAADARARIDDTAFGSCSDCGGAIGVERLMALPSTTRCVDCA